MTKRRFGFVRADSLTDKKIKPVLLVGMLAWAVGTLGQYTGVAAPIGSARRVSSVASVTVAATPVTQTVVQEVAQQIAQTAPVQAAAAAGQMAADVMAPKEENVDRQVELGKGETFTEMLADSDVDPAEAGAISAALADVYDLRKLKAGQEVNLSFIRRGMDETIDSVTFQPELTKEIKIARVDGGVFKAEAKKTPIERQRIAARTEIKSSLYEAGAHAGIPNNIMASLMRVYAHSVDFQRDIHQGDTFEVLYDQPTAKDGTPVGEGTIIYASLNIGGKAKPLYRVTFGDGSVDYFDAKGQSIRRALLRTPVDSARVTSNFGMRMHPLLGYSKMHKGVDFGAHMGSPIYAAGSGVIEEAGFKGAYGRYIRIRHSGQTRTAYAHMSRFARTVYEGAHVNQGDVIGFVGMTGRSTGPHLHFEVIVNGQQANPLSISMPTGRTLEGKAFTQFNAGQDRIKKEFSSLLSSDDSGKSEPKKVASNSDSSAKVSAR